MRPLVLLLMFVFSAGGADEQKPDLPRPIKSNPQDDPLRKLLVQRYNEGVEEMKLTVLSLKSGQATEAELFDVLRRLLQASVDFETKERVALLRPILKHAKYLEKTEEKLLKSGLARKETVLKFRSLRLEVEIHLLKAEMKSK